MIKLSTTLAAAASFETDLVTTAKNEFATYGGLHECDSDVMNNRIAMYWDNLPGKEERTGCRGDAPNDPPVAWSAAFISFMVATAGAGPDEFCYSSRHSDYICNAFNSGTGLLYTEAVNAETNEPQTGDLMCYGREGTTDWTFADFQGWANGQNPANCLCDFERSHCDIVTAVNGAGHVTTIGGNLDDQVRERTRPWADGYYKVLLKVTREEEKQQPGGCFSRDMTVEVKNKGTVPIGAIQVGDYVRSSTGFSLVYSFFHKNTHVVRDFVQITTQDGKLLEATPEHFVIANAKTVRADHVRVGDFMQGLNGHDVRVSKIGTIQRRGIFGFGTLSGDAYINGLLASNYIHQKVALSKDTALDLNVLSHVLLSPLRLVCTTSLQFCHAETFNHDGLSNLVVPFLQSVELFLVMPYPLQIITALLAVPLLVLCNLAELLLANAILCAAVFLIAVVCMASKLQMKKAKTV